jgi:hypothetical protein
MSQNWHRPGPGLDAVHQLVGTAWNDQVDAVGVELEQLVNVLARVQQADSFPWHVGRFEGLLGEPVQYLVRVGGLRAAFQEQAVARADAQSGDLV